MHAPLTVVQRAMSTRPMLITVVETIEPIIRNGIVSATSVSGRTDSCHAGPIASATSSGDTAPMPHRTGKVTNAISRTPSRVLAATARGSCWIFANAANATPLMMPAARCIGSDARWTATE